MYSHCKVCNSEISNERLSDPVVICSGCGTIQGDSEERSIDRVAKSYLKIAVIGSFLAVSAFYFVTQWGAHSLEALPLKIGQFTHTANSTQLYRLSQISEELGRPQQAISSLKQALSSTPNHLEATKALADLSYKIKNWSQARNFYIQYRSLGGRNLEVDFRLARIWSKEGKIKEAEALYEKILKSKPSVFQITVARAYIEDLLSNGRTKKAIKVIKKIQKMGDNTRYFMEGQLDNLNRGKNG